MCVGMVLLVLVLTSAPAPTAPMTPPNAALAAVLAAARLPAQTPDFPIDVVFTWVDGKDVGWWAAKAAAFKRFFGRAFVGNARDPNGPQDAFHDELFYSVHSVAKFLPWVRRIWIVTAFAQVPDWLPSTKVVGNGMPVTVVHHSSIFNTACVAPDVTFNSNSIEAQLPHIRALSEHFIYFNDDMFVGAPMARTDFFTDTGTPVVLLRESRRLVQSLRTPWGTNLQNLYAKADSLGVTMTGLPVHVAAPVRKSVLRAVVKALKSSVCAWKPFRTLQDFPVWYLALNAAPHVAPAAHIKWAYYATGAAFVSAVGRAVNADDNGLPLPHLLCINESFTESAAKVWDAILGRP